MEVSNVISIQDASQAIPAYLGTYPKGSLLVQFETSEFSVGDTIRHDGTIAYWNEREWDIIDRGGVCCLNSKVSKWMVIAGCRKV